MSESTNETAPDDEEARRVPPLPPVAQALCDWSATDVTAEAYLEGGTVFVSGDWQATKDGLLGVETDGGRLWFVDPARVLFVSYAEDNDATWTMNRSG